MALADDDKKLGQKAVETKKMMKKMKKKMKKKKRAEIEAKPAEIDQM